MNLQTFAVSAPGRLGLHPHCKTSPQIGAALRQLHLDVGQVEACVDEVYPKFMQVINNAHFEREACFVYALQALFAVTLLTHGAIEEGVDASLNKMLVRTETEFAKLKADKLDEVIAAELLRIGFIDGADDDIAKCFKRMMFGDAWKAMLEEGYCRVGVAVRSSIDRLLCVHFNQNSFEETATHGVVN